MIQSANDWASPDPGKNITLADADRLRATLAATLQVQFANRYIRTTADQIITEAQLRADPFIVPLAVNLYGHLAAGSSQEINIAEFRTALRNAAAAQDPTGTLVGLLSGAMPQLDVPALFTRLPAVQQAIQSALAQI